MRYHFGCGKSRLEGYVNVDIEETDATDLVLDLGEPVLPHSEVEGAFSHAFFEHLYREQRVPHLRAVRDALASQGFVCYLGLPDFHRIAELYLTQGPGVVGPVFDLWNVYRYTHGDPEQTRSTRAGGFDSWVAQLHKSLFDVHEVDRLLSEAGYPSWVSFRYAFPMDPGSLDINLGFYAERRPRRPDALRDRCRKFLGEFDGRFIDLASVRYESGSYRPRPVASLATAPGGRRLRRAAYFALARLTRWFSPV